jgi:hypothetical protein
MPGLAAASVIDGHHHEYRDQEDARDRDFIGCRHERGIIKNGSAVFATPGFATP